MVIFIFVQLIVLLLIQICGGCNKTFSSLEGTIRSPTGDGTEYPNNVLCTYTIKGSSGIQEVTLTVESFHLESIFSTCATDYLKIGDGQKYCGKSLNGRTLKYTFINSFRLLFKTDGSLTYSGFIIKFKLSCDTTFKAPEGVIVSPPGPVSKYPNNARCTYDIVPGSGKQYVTFNVDKFHLESQDSCSYDYLKFGEGSKKCGTSLQGESISYKFTDSLKLYFRSDGSGTYSGFRIRYITTCNTIYTAFEGTIRSPVDDGSVYPEDIICSYTINGNTGKQALVFTVEQFSLEVHDSCKYDYLRFGDDQPYCGSTLQGEVLNYEFSNSFRLLFKTDSSKSFSGFVIKYKVICATSFTANVGTVKSPVDYSSHYPNDLNCVYTIHGGSRLQTLQLTVRQFSIEDHGSCGYDYLRFGEGPKYCGYSLKGGSVLTYNFTDTFKLYFKTDVNETRKGFVIDYKITKYCESGRYGSECESSCSVGCSDVCNKQDGTCTCKPGYTGSRCETETITTGCQDGKYGVSCASVCSDGCSDVCNKQDGKCTCRPGRTGPKCETECRDGNYGYYCVKACSPGCAGDTCDKNNGSCHCKPGYSGNMCNTTCNSGNYGTNCDRSCSNGCSDVCKTRDGTCTCRSGYTGSRCDTECQNGTHGSYCIKECSPGCVDKCNKTDGSCTCRSGYRGNSCDMECSSGTYGQNCESSCNKGCSEVCNKHDGTCMCKDGFKGPRCDAVCDTGQYGTNCGKGCNPGCIDTCRKTDGNCGCKPGFKGDRCDKVCNSGKYGSRCNKTCSDGCKGNTCHSVIGHCQCLPGWSGLQCQDRCSPNTYGDNCVSPCAVGCKPNSCDAETGDCDCLPGWHGARCQQECDNGRFGPNCDTQCGAGCMDNTCVKDNGTCTCKPGYGGNNCKEVQGVSMTRVILISGTSGVTLVIFLTVIIVCKHRQRVKTDKRVIRAKVKHLENDMVLKPVAPEQAHPSRDDDSIIYFDPDEIDDPLYENNYSLPEPECTVSQYFETGDVRPLQESDYCNMATCEPPKPCAIVHYANHNVIIEDDQHLYDLIPQCGNTTVTDGDEAVYENVRDGRAGDNQDV